MWQTDKASMLDEAIEYLKQLQFQVQVCIMNYCSILSPHLNWNLCEIKCLSYLFLLEILGTCVIMY